MLHFLTLLRLLTCALANSLTDSTLSCSACSTWPVLLSGLGSVVMVGR